ncbi:predicted protein [Fibroporia radiculosa]|uniref:Uncharacterized protein n=1 Tax=Fibroporia radiculosa TaxID=599839 RepID=J4H5H3_9APHY|nr:predicted protein [Fibroporia radiculosa]
MPEDVKNSMLGRDLIAFGLHLVR